jgi:hypothetical protein
VVVAQRKIRRAKITHVSLCRRGVNHLPVLMKSSGRLQVEMLTKAAKEGIVYALVYLPDVPDREGDVATREVIKAMAHDFLANAAEANGGIDIEHNFKVLTPDQVRIAETFIVQKGDPRFEGWKDHSGNQVNPDGAWGMALKVLDPTLRSEFESGNLNGVSMFGHAELEPIGKSDSNAHNPNQPQENPMTPQEMAALGAEIAKAVVTALKPAPETPVQKAQIEFEGDITNEADLRAHEDKLFMASLDLSKPSDVAKLRKHVAARKAEDAKAEALAKSQNPNAGRIAELEKELGELRKASGAPVTKAAEGDNAEQPTQSGALSKAERTQWDSGKKAAQSVMAKLGIPTASGKKA